jgi:hypothetical protein
VDASLKSNKGFVVAYHDLKTGKDHETPQHYELELEIEGIERVGLLLSKEIYRYENDTHRFFIAMSGYLSHDFNMQEGKVSGDGTIHTDDTYSAKADADYWFTKNYLYDGWDYKAPSHGIGYGFHAEICYENLSDNWMARLLLNDIFSRSIWNNLPRSIVHIKTENEHIGDDGYVEYDPTVSGYEIYENHTFKISPKYDLSFRKGISEYFIKAGVEGTSFFHLPYLGLGKVFERSVLEVFYESRFDSIGVSYTKNRYFLKLFANGWKDVSALGFSMGFSF